MTSSVERFAMVPPLSVGSHCHFDDGWTGMCVMEAVAFVAGEEWSDSPECACPVIGTILRNWNDTMQESERDNLLRLLIPRLIGTRGSPALQHRRMLMAIDWLVREHLPSWLRVGGLRDVAEVLESTKPIIHMLDVRGVRLLLDAAETILTWRNDDAGLYRPSSCSAEGDAVCHALTPHIFPDIEYSDDDIRALRYVKETAERIIHNETVSNAHCRMHQQSMLKLINRMIDAEEPLPLLAQRQGEAT